MADQWQWFIQANPAAKATGDAWTTAMTDAELIALAVKMREAQKAYFKGRTREQLIASKELEAVFDKEIARRAAQEAGHE